MDELAKEIWDTLSQIDVSKHVEKKNGLNYLSWAWAWGILMSKYPNTNYAFTKETLDDGTVEITSTVAIIKGEHQIRRSMWLPVMNYKNQAIKNPDAFAINTTKMRVLVKCLAMFGLGFTVYAGDDLDVPVESDDNYISGPDAEVIRMMIIKSKSDMEKFCQAFGVDTVEQLKTSQHEKALSMLKRKLNASA